MVLFFALSLWSFFRSGSLGGERNIFPLLSRRSRGEEGVSGGRDEFVSYLFLLGDENNDDDKGSARAVPSPSAAPAGRCSGDFCPTCNSGGSLPRGPHDPSPSLLLKRLAMGSAAALPRGGRGTESGKPQAPRGAGAQPLTRRGGFCPPGGERPPCPALPAPGLQGHGAAEPLL